MSEQPPSKNSESDLANELFGEGFVSSAAKHVKRAEYELQRGALEQVTEHLKRASGSLTKGAITSPSPHLTDAENEEFLFLKGKRYTVTESGFVEFNQLSPTETERFNIL